MSKSLEQIRNQVREQVMAKNLAEQSAGDTKKLVDALTLVPQKKMLDDVQYLLNDLLPRIESKNGDKSAEYKFFRGLVDDIMWAIFTMSRYENLLRKFQNTQLLSEIYQQRMELAETELLKYQTVEDTIQAGTLEDVRRAVLARGEEWIKELTNKN